MTLLPARSNLFWGAATLAVIAAATAAPIDVALPSPYLESAIVDPTGKWIALGDTEGGVTLLSADEGAVLNRWPAMGNNQITKLAFSADGTELLTVSPNRVIRILDTQGARAERAHWNLPEYFPGADLTPDGKHVLAVTYDGPIRWYDIATKNPLTEWRDENQPHGYSYVRVLRDDGLAVIVPIRGDGALIDASRGRVLARLPIVRVTDDRRIHTEDDVVLRVEGGVLAWSRKDLLAAADAANPIAAVQTWRVSVGGPVGYAALASAPTSTLAFWAVESPRSHAEWMEPSWDEHRPLGFVRPMVVDWARRRLWYQSSKGHFQGWSWDELGRPDALAISPYSRPPEIVGGNDVVVDAPGGSPSVVDWREMAPISNGHQSQTNGPNETVGRTFENDVEIESEISGTWVGKLDTAEGWTLAWRTSDGKATAPTSLGFHNTRPGISISSHGIAAVYSTTPGVVVLGGSHPQPTPIGIDGVNVTVPAVQLFAPGKVRPLGAFEDHRFTGVLQVRWSTNGQWIATRDYDGSGNGAGALRVFTVPDGRRVGPARPTKQSGDYVVGNDGSLLWSDADGLVQLVRPGGVPQTIFPTGGSTRSARVALSPAGDKVAVLTGTDEVVVVQVATGAEVKRFRLPVSNGLGWEEPRGGLVFVTPTTIVVAHGRSAALRRLEL